MNLLVGDVSSRDIGQFTHFSVKCSTNSAVLVASETDISTWYLAFVKFSLLFSLSLTGSFL